MLFRKHDCTHICQVIIVDRIEGDFPIALRDEIESVNVRNKHSTRGFHLEPFHFVPSKALEKVQPPDLKPVRYRSLCQRSLGAMDVGGSSSRTPRAGSQRMQSVERIPYERATEFISQDMAWTGKTYSDEIRFIGSLTRKRFNRVVHFLTHSRLRARGSGPITTGSCRIYPPSQSRESGVDIVAMSETSAAMTDHCRVEGKVGCSDMILRDERCKAQSTLRKIVLTPLCSAPSHGVRPVSISFSITPSDQKSASMPYLQKQHIQCHRRRGTSSSNTTEG
jgi:hypothetical protein